jgi:hypothetical protein
MTDTADLLRDELVEKERQMFIKDINHVRTLLKKHNAMDLEDMLLKDMENHTTRIALPGSINGRS